MMRAAMVPVHRLVLLAGLLSVGGCRDAPKPEPVKKSSRGEVSSEQQAQRGRELGELVRRCKAGETCPSADSPAGKACAAVEAIEVLGSEMAAFRSDDPKKIEAATEYYRKIFTRHEAAAKSGGVEQTRVFAESSAKALTELQGAKSPESMRGAVMRHLGELGRFQRWCTIGDAELPEAAK